MFLIIALFLFIAAFPIIAKVLQSNELLMVVSMLITALIVVFLLISLVINLAF